MQLVLLLWCLGEFYLAIFFLSYRKSSVGSYLAQFMYFRRCRVLGKDPFVQILHDIAMYYDANSWRSLATIYNTDATTQRKHRTSMKKGVQLVSFSVLFVCLFCFFSFCHYINYIQYKAQTENGVAEDKYGRISLGHSTFVYIANRIKQGKVS